MPIPGVYQRVAKGQQSQKKLGTVQNPKHFKDQDFDKIREACFNRRQLFEDDTFPANVNSIGHQLLPREKLSSIRWKRPNEINRDPRFLVDGANIFDIVQGEIGDCWVLAVVGGLTLRRKYLENVIPKDQEFTYKYAGIFHFRFWQFGEWVDVVVDDRLPFLNQRYLSVQPRSSNEFWPSLLEKAYAKLRGSYQNLHWGFISEAFVDFTGGVQMDFNLTKPPSDFRDIVVAAARSGSLMGATTPGEQRAGNTELQNGLVQGHAYSVTDARQVEYSSRTEDIVRVWNPWGQGEWNGRWSDGSSQWERVRPEIRNKLNVQRNDGEFWISCQDFLQNYNFATICNHSPSFLDFGSPQYAWKTFTYINKWVEGNASSSISTADIWKNPQYLINVSESEGGKRCYNVTVALMQSLANEHRYNNGWFPIGFLLCKVDTKGLKSGTQEKYYPQQATETINTGLENVREVTRSFMVPPGSYVIIPFALNNGQESQFLLRIFLKTKELADYSEADTKEDNQTYPNSSGINYPEMKTKSREDNKAVYRKDDLLSDFSSKLSLNTPNPKAVLKRYVDDSYDKIFVRYCDQNSEMYAEQLQRLLNEVVLTDPTFNADRGEFTLDGCRGILMLMDLNANGRLNLKEFGRLWKRLNMCKDIFRTLDVIQSGFIDGQGLRSAVQEAGLMVSDAVVNVMLLRYGDSTDKINFSDFVCCMIRLETVTKVFQNLSKDGQGVYLSGEEWMQIIMSS
ncbi:calpain-13-like [Bombina bombina]|uniref:calpain-13-like n=1 Tax=Bombina bombina TaxID=8345 RepID=UPI00235A70B3|nr:calpain-13-like [Bombina bombina]